MEADHPNTQLVIGITGQLGSGKTTAAEYLAAEHGFNHIRYSQVLADWFNEDPERKSELQAVGWDVMSGGSQAELNRRLLSKTTAGGNWVVEGLRHPLDYKSLKDAFTSRLHLVYIDSSREQRWLRLQKRGRFRTFEEFSTADQHPVEQLIPHLKQFAELCITSSEPLQQLYEPLNKFVLSIRKETQ
ncbi:MAG TPA: AAA family ATPase [Candidatus Angelobacter sp.]|jgi:dephospho-CoA kinase